MRYGSARRALATLIALAVSGAVLIAAAQGSSAATPALASTMLAGQELRPPNTSNSDRYALLSSNGVYQFSIYYNATSASTGGVGIEIDEWSPPVWDGTWTQTGNATPSTDLILQADGNLVLYAKAGVSVWSTHTAGTGSRNRLVMQDDGNLVLYNGAGRALWMSHTHQQVLGVGAKLTAGHRLVNAYSHSDPPTVLTMRSDGDLVVTYHGATVWASNTLVPGSYATMQPDGDLVVYGNGAVQWTSRTAGKAGSDGVRPFLDVQPDGHFVLGVTPPTSTGGAIQTVFDSVTRPGEFGRAHPRTPLRLMTPRSILHPGQSLISSNGYQLTMQTNGNLVQRGPRGSVRWQTHTSGHAGACLTMRPSGNIALVYNKHVLWSTHTASSRYPATINFAMQGNGNQVARDALGHVTWSSRTRA